jgi:hypothetical protein
VVAVGLLVAFIAGIALPNAPGPGLAVWLAVTDAGLAFAAVGLATATLDVAAPRTGAALAVLAVTVGLAAWGSPDLLGRLTGSAGLVRWIVLVLIGLGIPAAFFLRPDRPLPAAPATAPAPEPEAEH